MQERIRQEKLRDEQKHLREQEEAIRKRQDEISKELMGQGVAEDATDSGLKICDAIPGQVFQGNKPKSATLISVGQDQAKVQEQQQQSIMKDQSSSTSAATVQRR